MLQKFTEKTAKLEAHQTVDGRNPASYKVGPYLIVINGVISPL